MQLNKGENGGWALYTSYTMCKSKKTAPMVRVGGGVERGAWAWFRDLHGGTEEHADRERKIYEVWARRRTAGEEEARLAKEVQLQHLQKEMQRESRKAIKSSFGSAHTHPLNLVAGSW
jgi:hypothetical protein